MAWLRRDRKPSHRAAEDIDLDSLLALVAESRGYNCAFAVDGHSLTLAPAPDPGPDVPDPDGLGPGPGALDAVRRDGERGREIVVRLTGLRRVAGRRTREDWPMLVSEHLTHAVAVAGDPLDVCDLAQAGPSLRTRVEAVDEVPDLTRVVGRHLNADLVELLTVGSRLVRPEEAGCWPVAPGRALEMAASNVRRERLSVEDIHLSGTPVSRLTGEGPSTATHLRWLADYLPVPADGVLAVLPDPYTLLVYPVTGIGAVRAIERLRVHAARTGGLSAQVYWWHEGRLRLIKADIVLHGGQTRLVVAPPPEFARVLARLAA
ncbi:hypothetical protein ACWGH8_20795 [Nonomuraea muscovyensis]|uniref:Uncharacterized protein n=1 Tax=Nonomuraea muscovyensis TaxID=1124761 RepID=A0A7X0C6A3_9ACTN|nr:hypothetical protein [Nonomuraea muscovyensis]MBB6348406.1 hypothetical protein [Nonomuraea muscovyensis]MDF2707925.1 hypothetical protein [Nonomuraea muscovyensis]